MRSSKLGAIPSDLGWLVDELADISERLRTLEAPSGESLSSAVERLQTLVKPVAIYRQENLPSTVPTATTFAAVSRPVPAGYTRAVVNVTAAASLRSNQAAGSSTALTCAAIVAASGGAFANQLTSVDGQKYGTISATSAATLEGLEPGETVDVHALVSFPTAISSGSASVAGTILFLR